MKNLITPSYARVFNPLSKVFFTLVCLSFFYSLGYSQVIDYGYRDDVGGTIEIGQYRFPANGATEVAYNPVFFLFPRLTSNTTLSSTIQIGTAVSGGSIVSPASHETDGAEFDFNIELDPNTTYYWRVIRNGKSTAVWSFTTIAEPSGNGPSLTSPANGAEKLGGDLKPFTFVWSAVSGASEYHIQITRASAFDAPYPFQEQDSAVTTNTYTAIALYPDTTYQWRVRARVGGTWGDWSQVRWFSTHLINARSPAVRDAFIRNYTAVDIITSEDQSRLDTLTRQDIRGGDANQDEVSSNLPENRLDLSGQGLTPANLRWGDLTFLGQNAIVDLRRNPDLDDLQTYTLSGYFAGGSKNQLLLPAHLEPSGTAEEIVDVYRQWGLGRNLKGDALPALLSVAFNDDVFVPTPQQESPAHSSSRDLTLTLDWGEVPGASSYELQISPDRNIFRAVDEELVTGSGSNRDTVILKRNLIRDSMLTSDMATVTFNAAEAGTYYWRVRASGGSPALNSNWSVPWRVSVSQLSVFFGSVKTEHTHILGNPWSNIELPLATGGSGTLTYTISTAIAENSGGESFGGTIVNNLPSGMIYTSGTPAVLGGVPDVAGGYDITWRATDPDGRTAEVVIRIIVEGSDIELFGEVSIGTKLYLINQPIEPDSLPRAADAGDLTYRLAPLPPGLAFDADTRVLSGTPSAKGRYQVVYQVEDGSLQQIPTDYITFTVVVLEGDVLPNRVENMEDLSAVEDSLDGNYLLLEDITVGADFEPIGSEEAPFTGNFVGDGYTITLDVEAAAGESDSAEVAVFEFIDSSATVSYVFVKSGSSRSSQGSARAVRNQGTSVDTNAAATMALLAIRNKGTIENSGVMGDVSATEKGAGLVVYNEGTIRNSYAIVRMNPVLKEEGGNESVSVMGGLVAENSGTIENSFVVLMDRVQFPSGVTNGTLGGFVGVNADSGSITNSYVVGGVYGQHASTVVGIFGGDNQGTITNSYVNVDFDPEYLAILQLSQNPNFPQSAIPSYSPVGNAGEGEDVISDVNPVTHDEMLAEKFANDLGDAYVYSAGSYPKLYSYQSSDTLVGNNGIQNSYLNVIPSYTNPAWRMLSFSVSDVSWKSSYFRYPINGYGDDGSVSQLNMFYGYDGSHWLPDYTIQSPASGYTLPNRQVTGMGFIYYLGGSDSEPSERSLILGIPNQENVIVDLSTESPGWNLLGNPYDSDLAASTSDIVSWGGSSGLNSYNILILNDNGAYESSTQIKKGQGFLVSNNTAASLTIPYSSRTSATKARVNESMIIVSIDGYNDGKSRLYSDNVVFMFDEQAQKGKDYYDLRYLTPFYSYDEDGAYRLSLASRMEENDVLYKILASPIELDEVIQYDIVVSSEGKFDHYEMTWDTQNLPEGWSVYLEDVTTGERIDIKSNNRYALKEAFKTSASVQKADELFDAMRPPALDIVKSTDLANFRLIVDPNGKNVVLPPNELALHQNYPNPFNPVTVIPFDIPQQSIINLTVYNILGQQVATLLSNKLYTSGRHQVTWDASKYASGLYIYVLQVGEQRLIKKLTLIK